MYPITSFDSRLFVAYQSSRTGPVLFREVREECKRIWECRCVVASLCCKSQWSHLTPPAGFHFKSPAFVQKCICSLILFGNCVKQKRTNGEENHPFSLSPTTPSHCHLVASLSLSDCTSLSLSASAYFAGDANDLPPLYSDARSVYTFPFHPHTNVLLLPLRPRAF